ncbi:MAG: hypothetical protein AAGK04_07370 [Planctomycetota bacterium]
MARGAWDTLVGLVAIGWAIARSRGGPRGRYWTWRWQTAFGRGAPPRGELVRGLLHYARWIAAMRRLR